MHTIYCTYIHLNIHVHILYIINICFKNKNIYIYIYCAYNIHYIESSILGISQRFITAADSSVLILYSSNIF